MGVSAREHAIVTCATWNSESTSLAVGTNSGFIIYSTETDFSDRGGLEEVVRRDVEGGVGLIALYGQSNVLLLAGWEHDYAAVVTLWDDARITSHSAGCAVVAKLTLPSPVRALRLHSCLLLVSESTSVHVFDHHLMPLERFGISEIPTGVIAPMAGGNANDTMALASLLVEEQAAGMLCLVLRFVITGPTVGSVRCVRYIHDIREKRYGLARPIAPGDHALYAQVLELHHGAIRCISITPDGSKAVSVSERGTALKVIDVRNCVCLLQLSRGATTNIVHSVAINPAATLAMCISISGTLHVFDLLQPIADGDADGTREAAGSRELEMWRRSSGSAVHPSRGTPAQVGARASISRVLQDSMKYARSTGASFRFLVPDEAGGISDASDASTFKGQRRLALKPHVKDGVTTAFVVEHSTTACERQARCLRLVVDTKERLARVDRTYVLPRETLV